MLCKSKDFFLNTLIKPYKVLGIDVGIKKTGIAIYMSEVKVALPLCIIYDVFNKLESLLEIINTKGINGIIIGISNVQNQDIKINISYKFAKFLTKHVNLPIILSDESFTTSLANKLLKQQNMNRKKRAEIDDMVSASIILQDFFKKI